MRADAIIDEIKQRLDIVEVINRYLPLRKAGRSYKGFCPFHANSRTEALMVFPHTNTWHCFGACGTGGDIFAFVQKREGLGFRETLELLAAQAGIELAPQNQAQAEQQARREKLRTVLESAAALFGEWLRERPDAEICRAYLAQRQVAHATWDHFGLGYAPQGWDTLVTVLGPLGRGYSLDDLAAVGLIKSGDRGGVYDAFRHRLIFPIRDARGRVIGFGGRTLGDEQGPKYLNSPQSELFDKSKTLYALDLAREEIRRVNRAVIVEGYMDVIAAHQAGFTNVVASLGTALTPDQFKLLKRFSPNLTLALDADDAGSAATRRGVATARDALDRRAVVAIRGEGLVRLGFELASDLRVMTLPPGTDPDELIQADPSQWSELVAGALPVVDYLFKSTIAGVDLNNPIEKQQAAQELLPIVAEIGDVISRSHYLQRLAWALRVDERDLATQMVALTRSTRLSAPSARRPQADEPPPLSEDEAFFPDEEDPFWGADPSPAPTSRSRGPTPPSPFGQEEWLLFLLLQRPSVLTEPPATELQAEDWSNTQNRALFEWLQQQAPQDGLSVEDLIEELDPTLQVTLRRIVTHYGRIPPLPDEQWPRSFQDALDQVKLIADKRQAQTLHFLISDLQRMAPSERDDGQLQATIQSHAALNRRIFLRQRAQHGRTERAKLERTLKSE